MSENLPANLEPSRTPARVDELPPNATMTQFLAAALLDERVTVDKLRELYAFQRDVKKDQLEEEFDEAMARLQVKLPKIKKTRTIEVKGKVRSHFAALEDIDEICRPLYTAEDFAVDYDTDIQGEGKVGVIIYVSRRGFKKTRRVIIPLDKSEYRSAVQNYGATITFARRYAFCLAFNIVTGGEDDDGTATTVLTEQEYNAIEDLLHELGGSAREGLLAFVGYKATSEIPRGAYHAATSWCLAKRRQLGQQKQT